MTGQNTGQREDHSYQKQRWYVFVVTLAVIVALIVVAVVL